MPRFCAIGELGVKVQKEEIIWDFAVTVFKGNSSLQNVQLLELSPWFFENNGALGKEVDKEEPTDWRA